jgi:hypothetical protein
MEPWTSTGHSEYQFGLIGYVGAQIHISETIRVLVSYIASHLGLVGFKVASNRLGHIGEANGCGSN